MVHDEALDVLREIWAGLPKGVVASLGTVLTGEGADWARLAKELYEFCPDLVDQGVGSLDELERALSADGRIFLWWD